MKTVLLTGATGYIGQYAIDFLRRKNYVVHAVSSKPQNNESREDLVWHQVNLLDEEESKNLIKKVRPTHLLHFAWYVEHGKFWNAPENLDWLRSSLFLAKEFAESGGQRIVTAGTCAEYDWTAPSPFVEDKTPFCPQTLYGASKYSLDLTLDKFSKIANLSFATGKIFFPFGRNESPNRLIPSVIDNLLRNREAKTSHGNQIRDFMFADDVAEAFTALLDSEITGRVNIASGKGVKLKDVITQLGEITGRSELLRIGAIPASPNEPPEIVADTKRLNDEVGFKKDFNLEEKLTETVEQWKEIYEVND